MNKPFHLTLLSFSICLLCFLTGCKSQEALTKKEGITLADLNIEEVKDSPLSGVKPDEKPPLPPPSDQLLPNSILFKAKVVEIKPEGSFDYSKGKCGLNPCFATLQIEQIIQTGMGTISTLKTQEEITVLFPNTLEGARIGKSNFEKLSLNDRIEGLIIESESNEIWSMNGFTYTMNKYSKL